MSARCNRSPVCEARDHHADCAYVTGVPTLARWNAAAKHAGLGVGHIWYEVACPAYRTLDPADCTCIHHHTCTCTLTSHHAPRDEVLSPRPNGEGERA